MLGGICLRGLYMCPSLCIRFISFQKSAQKMKLSGNLVKHLKNSLKNFFVLTSYSSFVITKLDSKWQTTCFLRINQDNDFDKDISRANSRLARIEWRESALGPQVSLVIEGLEMFRVYTYTYSLTYTHTVCMCAWGSVYTQ